MAKQRKKEPDIDLERTLTVSSAHGVLQRTFDPEVIQSFRYMATELTLNIELPPSIAVVAALRGEGVTYTTLALAATIASDTGARICVVELNWWAPGLMNLLDPRGVETGKKKGKKKEVETPREPLLPDHPRLEHVLYGEASLEAALIHTNIPNFDLLATGSLPIAKRPAIARSAALRKLIAELSERYDHLFFDIPAIRTTSDAIVLASFGTACIVVTRQGATSVNSVRQALDDVKSMTMLGVVLNQVTIYTPDLLRNLIPQE